MAIIIKHLPTENEYIFLGTHLGSEKFLPSKMLGDFFSTDEPEKAKLVAVCDSNGQILWLNATEVIVVEIDGQLPSELLPETVTTPSVPLADEKEAIEGKVDEFSEDDEEWI